MLIILTNISSIFIYILVGFIANKTKLLPDESNKYLVNLLFNITSPCLIMASIVTKEINEKTYIETFQTLAFSITFFIVVSILALLLLKPIKNYPDKNILLVVITSVNSAFIGFPIAKAVFGNDIFYLIVIANVMLNIYFFSICIWQLNYGDEQRITVKSVFKPLLNILSIVTFISVIMLFANIKLPDYPLHIIETLGDATIPLSMIVVGVQLGSSNFQKVFRNHQLIYASLCNVILIPALTLLVMYNLPVSDNIKLAITLSAIFPCAVLPVALAHKQGKNATLLAEGVAVTTLFSIITIPAWLIVLVPLFT